KVWLARNWPRTVAFGIVAGLFFLFLLAIILPHPDTASERAKRIKCASNLKQIGVSAIQYANEHGGRFPDDLETLLKDQDLYPAVLNCPDTYDSPASGPT